MEAPCDPRRTLGGREIRLLKIHPGTLNDKVCCSIEVVSLDAHPHYEALSYSWGAPKPGPDDPEIILDGYPIKILGNLHNALRYLRYRPLDDPSPPREHGAFIDVNDVGDGVEIKDPGHLSENVRGELRVLWADAICIKQDDDAEKIAQVPLMGDIYTNCSKVIVWLGQSLDSTERAFMMAYWLCKVSYHQRKLESAGQDGAGGGWRRWLDRGSKGGSKHGDAHPNHTESWRPDGTKSKPSFKTMIQLDNVGVKTTMCLCWKELQALFRRDWFSRAWVVQEAALSREVLIVCGEYSISWSQLLIALQCVPSIPIRPLGGVPLPSHMVVIEKLRQELADGQSSLEKILLRNSNCKATNPVDRIYAFCGLIGQPELEELGLLVPDYGERGPSWNGEKAEGLFKGLCKKVTVNILNRSGTLDLLSGPVGNPKARPDWPSWIPDWEAENRPRCLALDQLSFNAARGERSPQGVVFGDAEALLGLEGFVFDRVEAMSNVVDKGPPSTWTFAQFQTYKARMETMVEFLQRCLEWEDITNARSNGRYVGGAEPMLDAYWKTLLGGHVTAENAERQGEEFHRFDMISKAGAKVLRDLGLPAWPWIMALTPYNIAVLFSRAFLTRRDYAGLFRIGDFTSNPNHAFVMNRRIIRTSAGYIGLAPAATRCGDAVALFKGARVPFLIREKGDRWEIIGEGYIHGIMEGEVWDASKCRRIWLE